MGSYEPMGSDLDNRHYRNNLHDAAEKFSSLMTLSPIITAPNRRPLNWDRPCGLRGWVHHDSYGFIFERDGVSGDKDCREEQQEQECNQSGPEIKGFFPSPHFCRLLLSKSYGLFI